MKPLSNGRAAALVALVIATVTLGVAADQAFVTNRGGSTVTLFDTSTNTESAGSPVTVGSGPVAIAADRSSSPTKVFVANSGSNSVSVVQASPLGVAATISSDSFFGSFATPSGVALVDDGTVGPTIAVTDQKSTSYLFLGSPTAGRSTIRLIDPVSNAVVDAFQEPSATARYNAVVFTSTGGTRRLWIADDGDGGVTVLKLDGVSGQPPFYLNRVITYQGPGEFADFVADTSAAPAFLKAPRRLATNGTTRVVVADGGSKIATILDGTYASTNTLGEPGAILANVDLSTGPGASVGAFTCTDVAVVGNFAYVTTSNLAAAGSNVFQIDLTTFAITGGLALGGANGVAGLGATSDGGTLYVGAALVASGDLTQLDINPPSDFTVTPPVAVGPFTGGSIPFAFSISATVSGTPPPGPGPIWINPSNTGSSSHSGCGLLGLEAVALLLVLRRVRRT